MVEQNPPSINALSPSEATPQLTINHDVAADLDSSNAFEGPEKLLEVWFAPSANALPKGAHQDGLKAVSSETWVSMLNLVHCEILSVISSENVDAYLLSESSMFVFPHKLILKTCGTTTLLLGLHRMLQIAAELAGFPSHGAAFTKASTPLATPYRIFYSRKNFLFPDKQRGPHKSWSDEVKFLDDMFANGSAYLVGKMNGDHWYLYMTTPADVSTPPPTPVKSNKAGVNGHLEVSPTTEEESTPDETLEILMTDLDPENAKQFYMSHASAVASKRAPTQEREARQSAVTSLGGLEEIKQAAANINAGPDAAFDVFDNSAVDVKEAAMTETELLTTEGHALGTVIAENCGLSEVYSTSRYPDARIDSYLFSPCGFSANGVIPAPQSIADPAKPKSATESAAHYFTVHVTPEPHCSFASFETNVPGGQNGRETGEVIEHVVDIFKPGRFIVTLFEAKSPASLGSSFRHNSNDNAGPGSGVPELDRFRKKSAIKGYKRVDRIVHSFEDYDLVFGFFERDGWDGRRGTRVGEH